MGFLLLFVDGIGVGPATEHNPLAVSKLPLLGVHAGRLTPAGFEGLPRGWAGISLDATLGVDGLPQSATGQTALLTGKNAPLHVGAHQAALPGPTFRRLLLNHSILKTAREGGRSVTFANAYRPAFFDRLGAEPPRRVSASTLCTWSAGVRFRDLDDLAAGNAVYHDFTRATLLRKGFDVPSVTPEEAGGHLAGIVRDNDLTLYEHFLTDFAGHSRDSDEAHRLLGNLETLTVSVADALDPDTDGIALASDHGNLEDLSVSTHTRYPVPLLTWGRLRELLSREINDLTGVGPGILDLLADA